MESEPGTNSLAISSGADGQSSSTEVSATSVVDSLSKDDAHKLEAEQPGGSTSSANRCAALVKLQCKPLQEAGWVNSTKNVVEPTAATAQNHFLEASRPGRTRNSEPRPVATSDKDGFVSFGSSNLQEADRLPRTTNGGSGTAATGRTEMLGATGPETVIENNEEVSASEKQDESEDVSYDTGTLTFSQINLHHCTTASLALNEWFARQEKRGNSGVECSDAKIALIQEPYLSRGKVQGLHKNLKIFRGSNGPKIRACIATTDNIEAWLLTQFSNQDQTAIGLRMGGNILVVASTYMPYDSIDPPPPKILEELTLFCKEKKWSLLIGADANSHNTVWGSTDTNQRGDKLLDFILSSDLQICNVGDKPTFSNAVREEVIDITLATIEIERNVLDWKVSDEESFSDHNRIEFILKMNFTPLSVAYRNVRKTDWELFREELKKRTSWEIDESDSLEVITKRLTDSVQESYHVSCKLTKRKMGRKPPWWKESLSTLKREARRWKRKVRRNPSDENKEKKKLALREYTKEVHRAKREHWQIFCQEMMTLSTTGRISKILKTGVQQKIRTIKDGKVSDTPDEAFKNAS